MMNIFNFTNCQAIEEARLLVLKHIHDDYFLATLMQKDKFNHTSDTGLMIAKKLAEFSDSIYLRQYRPWNPFTKAIAYAKLPNIYFNSRKLFPVLDRAETIIHELCHCLGYSHRGNYNNEYNRGTVPYAVSRMFREYIESIKLQKLSHSRQETDGEERV